MQECIHTLPYSWHSPALRPPGWCRLESCPSLLTLLGVVLGGGSQSDLVSLPLCLSLSPHADFRVDDSSYSSLVAFSFNSNVNTNKTNTTREKKITMCFLSLKIGLFNLSCMMAPGWVWGFSNIYSLRRWQRKFWGKAKVCSETEKSRVATGSQWMQGCSPTIDSPTPVLKQENHPCFNAPIAVSTLLLF